MLASTARSRSLRRIAASCGIQSTRVGRKGDPVVVAGGLCQRLAVVLEHRGEVDAGVSEGAGELDRAKTSVDEHMREVDHRPLVRRSGQERHGVH